MSTSLVEIVESSGLEKTKADFILERFQGYFKLASEWETKAKALVVVDEKQVAEMRMAREGRLFLREKRIDIEKTRRQLKEQSLREGKAIDGIANVLKGLIEPIEEYLDEQERYVEIKEDKKKEARKMVRIAELSELGVVDTSMFDIKNMDESVYAAWVAGRKQEIQKKIEEDNRLEQERIAREKEQERIRIENERIKKELVEKEKAMIAERKKAEAEAKRIREESEKKLAREKQEREKAEAEAKRIREESEKKLAREKQEREKAEAELRRKAEAEAKRIREESEKKLAREKQEREKAEAELRRKAEAERQKAEAERKERARIESEKKKAESAPDFEKLKTLADFIIGITMPVVKDSVANAIVSKTRERLDNVASEIIKAIGGR